MRNSPSDRGFTLVETLVATALFGILMVSAMTLCATNQTACRRGQARTEAYQNARVALETAAREIRMAGYDLSGTIDTLAQPTSIQTADASTLTFVADIGLDGVLDRITYRQQGSQIIRDSAPWDGASFTPVTSSTVADGVTQLTYDYFDGTTPTNNTFAAPVAAANLTNIRRISITVVASATSVEAQATAALFEDIRIRN